MIDRLIKIASVLFLFFYPLYFFPLESNYLSSDKNFFLIFSSVFLLLLLLIKISAEKKFIYNKTPVNIVLILLVLAFLLSAFNSISNFSSSLFYPLGSGTVIAMVVIFYIFSSYFFYPETTLFHLFPLLLSTSLLSFLLIVRETKFFPFLSFLPFSLIGAPLSFLGFAAPVATLIICYLFFSFSSAQKPNYKIAQLKINHITEATVLIFFLLPIVTAIIISFFHLFTDQKVLFFPFEYGWSITMEIFKNFRHFLFGIGPGNFHIAYTIAKPIAVNSTPFWNIILSASSNYLLTLAVENGIASLLLIFFLVYLLLRSARNFYYQNITKSCLISLIVSAVFFLLLPTDISFFVLTFILLTSCIKKQKKEQLIINKQQSIIIILVGFALAISTLFFQGKFYISQLMLRRSLQSLTNQKALEAFADIQKAISFNPNSDTNYTLSSSISLALAQNLSSQTNASESAKQIQTLAQQAVSHARKAIEINRLNSQNWGQLAAVYQALTPSQETAQLAYQAFNQQIALDPASPLVKLNAALFLIKIGQLQQAQQFIAQTINLKPDWYLPHYHLASILKQSNQYQLASDELQKALNLTPENSNEYQIIKTELDQLNKIISSETSSTSSTGNFK